MSIINKRSPTMLRSPFPPDDAPTATNLSDEETRADDAVAVENAEARKGGVVETKKAEVLASVRSNQVAIKLNAASFLSLLDARIENLEANRPNSDESISAWMEELRVFKEMKESANSMLAAIEQFIADATKDNEAVAATLSFSAGLSSWWTKSHAEICDKGFDTGLFALGLSICWLAGAGGVVGALVAATVVKGQPIVDVIKAWVGSKSEKSAE